MPCARGEALTSHATSPVWDATRKRQEAVRVESHVPATNKGPFHQGHVAIPWDEYLHCFSLHCFSLHIALEPPGCSNFPCPTCANGFCLSLLRQASHTRATTRLLTDYSSSCPGSSSRTPPRLRSRRYIGPRPVHCVRPLVVASSLPLSNHRHATLEALSSLPRNLTSHVRSWSDQTNTCPPWSIRCPIVAQAVPLFPTTLRPSPTKASKSRSMTPSTLAAAACPTAFPKPCPLTPSLLAVLVL